MLATAGPCKKRIYNNPAFLPDFWNFSDAMVFDVLSGHPQDRRFFD